MYRYHLCDQSGYNHGGLSVILIGLFWNTNDSIATLTILIQVAFLCEKDVVIKTC